MNTITESVFDLAKTLAELKSAALEAEPGPWRTGPTGHEGHSGMYIESERLHLGFLSSAGGTQEANARFIRTANPTAMLALVAEFERLQAAAIPNGHVAVRESYLNETKNLARVATHLTEAVNEYHGLLQRVEDGEEAAHETDVDNARESLSEGMQAVRQSVYECEKRLPD